MSFPGKRTPYLETARPEIPVAPASSLPHRLGPLSKCIRIVPDIG